MDCNIFSIAKGHLGNLDLGRRIRLFNPCNNEYAIKTQCPDANFLKGARYSLTPLFPLLKFNTRFALLTHTITSASASKHQLIPSRRYTTNLLAVPIPLPKIGDMRFTSSTENQLKVLVNTISTLFATSLGQNMNYGGVLQNEITELAEECLKLCGEEGTSR
jgi:hypothetical protein